MTQFPDFSDSGLRPWPDRTLRSRPDRRPPVVLTGTPTMVPVDFDPDGLRIVRCSSCTRWWWAELVLAGSRVQLREWHRADCLEWGDDAAAVQDARALTSDTVVHRGSGFLGLVTGPAAGSDAP